MLHDGLEARDLQAVFGSEGEEMKKKEKMAEEYADHESNAHFTGAEGALREAFLAGFEAARALAVLEIDQERMHDAVEDWGAGHDAACVNLRRHIAQLGEEDA